MTNAELEKLKQKIKRLEETKSKITKEQDAIVEKMTSTFDITEMSDEVLILRTKVLKHPDWKPILEKYQISINDVGFIRLNEEHAGWYNLGGGPKLRDFWECTKWYLYGGPKNTVQVLIGRAGNNRPCIEGILLKVEGFKKPKKNILTKKAV